MIDIIEFLRKEGKHAMEIHSDIAQLLGYIRQIRRQLHQIPENSLEEWKTQALLRAELDKLHPDEVKVFANTGLRAVFYASNKGKTIAFRADMDALPISEETQHDYPSTHPGCMHACGHDGHMAALLGWAKYVSCHREQIKHNIVLIFQPAEEGVGGAGRMMEQGVLEAPNVDEIYGIHVDPRTESGTLGIRPGAMMAAVTEFDIHLKGASAHGAAPHLGKDAIVAAAELTGQLQTIVSRAVDPATKALITIGKIHGGDNRNIIAENVRLEGTFRTYDDAVTQLIRRRIHQLLAGLEASQGVGGAYRELVHFPPVVNDKELTRQTINLAPEDFASIEPRMTGEDFSFYQAAVPGVFAFVGVRRGENYAHSLHSNKFDFDEESLLPALELYRRILERERHV